MTRVLIGPAHLARNTGPYHHILTEAGLEPVFQTFNQQMTEAQLRQTLPGFRAVVAGSEPYTRAVLDACPDLRIIARVGVGYDSVDVAACTEKGIVVTYAPGTNQDAVAEHLFSLMLALAKSLVPQHAAIRAGDWPRHPSRPLRGQTLGIIGLGRIGKAAAIRALAFGMRVLAHEPFPDTAFCAAHGIGLRSFEDVLAESDYVSLHVPLTPTSRHLINKATIERMKPGAFLLNTARGALVNEADLYQALISGRLAGAGLDVFEREPPGADNPLVRLDTVVQTAHTAGVDTQSLSDMACSASRSLVALTRGEWPEDVIVNPEVRADWRWT